MPKSRSTKYITTKVLTTCFNDAKLYQKTKRGLELVFLAIFFCKYFFSFYHNKIHRATNYIAIKDKTNKTRQHRTNKRKQNKTKKKNKKENEMKLHATRPPPFPFWTEYQSIIWSTGCHFFINLNLLELVNSFSISLIFLLVIFKLSKLNCLVFLAL